MFESRTNTTSRDVGGGYGKILGDPLQEGGAEKVANPGAPREVGYVMGDRLVGLLEGGRFTGDEIDDIVACRHELGDDFPSMSGPRNVVWPRL